jgi:hypothetical protein
MDEEKKKKRRIWLSDNDADCMYVCEFAHMDVSNI